MRIKSARELGNAIIHRIYLLFLRFRLFVQLQLGLLKIYQPNPFAGWRQKKSLSMRGCIDRFEAFYALVPKNKPLSVLDIGCNQGYFVFRMAERGGLCIGIDWDRHKIEVAHALATVYNLPNALFAQMEVNEEIAATFPKVDMVICLSIFHHWACKLGENRAKEIMITISNCAEKYLIFETGQPNEVKKEWAEKLSFMAPDHETWIRKFLFELGFNKVHNVGQFSTSLSNVPRSLYVAVRKYNSC